MIVYGDAEAIEEAGAMLREVDAALADAAAAAPGIVRHGRLVAALVRAGELLQAVEDVTPPEQAETVGDPNAGRDGSAALRRLLDALAGAVVASWDSGFSDVPLPPAGDAGALADDLPAGPLRIRQPEGTAHYSLYPEAVAGAARRLPPGRWRVIGIRSIGTSLAAVAAAALGAEAWFTVRPTGHPFGRRLEASGAFTDAVLRGGERFAIVDEGPGLSGSSFGAVADWLEAAGVPREAIAFLPSHGGDLGPMAAASHRERWATVLRPTAGIDDLILCAERPAHRLEGWFADLSPGTTAAPIDIGGGAWRTLVHRRRQDWPAAFRMQERRKFLLDGPGGRLLLKFAGLGDLGDRKLALRRDLADSGFAPPVLALRHGFLAERWLDGAHPGLPLAGDALVGHLAAYLGHRAARFDAADRSGAKLADLADMAAHNLSEAGLDGDGLLARWRPDLERLQARVRPIAIDGRLHAHEWLTSADGRVFKTDAVDHHAAHDLIGCQDVAWDVAGAAVEFGLDPAAVEDLTARVARASGFPIDPDLVGFAKLAYAAFQLGRSTMAAETEADPGEAARHRNDAARYRYAALPARKLGLVAR